MTGCPVVSGVGVVEFVSVMVGTIRMVVDFVNYFRIFLLANATYWGKEPCYVEAQKRPSIFAERTPKLSDNGLGEIRRPPPKPQVENHAERSG